MPTTYYYFRSWRPPHVNQMDLFLATAGGEQDAGGAGAGTGRQAADLQSSPAVACNAASRGDLISLEPVGTTATRSTRALPARGHNSRALYNTPKPSKTLQNDAVLRDCKLYDSDDGRDWKETVEWVRVLNLPQDENTWTEKQFQTFFRAHKRACDQERQDRAASAKLERQIISELRQKFNLGAKEAALDSDSDGEGGGGRGEGAAAATDGSIRAVVSNGGGEGVAAELAAAATTRGEPDFISLECRTVGTKATVMLAQGLLVVRHLGGQCNVYSLATATDINLETATDINLGSTEGSPARGAALAAPPRRICKPAACNIRKGTSADYTGRRLP